MERATRCSCATWRRLGNSRRKQRSSSDLWHVAMAARSDAGMAATVRIGLAVSVEVNETSLIVRRVASSSGAEERPTRPAGADLRAPEDEPVRAEDRAPGAVRVRAPGPSGHPTRGGFRRREKAGPVSAPAERARLHHHDRSADRPAEPQPDAQRVLRKARVRKARVRRVRVHGLRHTCASLLLALGVDARTIVETLGHTTVTMTLGTSAHVRETTLTAAADQMRCAQGRRRRRLDGVPAAVRVAH